MFFRIRQLKNKTIHIATNIQFQGLKLAGDEIIQKIDNDLSSMSSKISDPFLRQLGISDDWKPIYNTESWSYKLWVEIEKHKYYYNDIKRYKQGLKWEFENRPSDKIPGRGMKWVDKTEAIINCKLVDCVSEVKETKELNKLTLKEKWLKIEQIDREIFEHLSLKLKQQMPLTDIELFQYKRFIICRQLDIDFYELERAGKEKVSEEEEAMGKTVAAERSRG